MINKIVLGTMEFGRRLSESQCLEMVQKFSSFGFNEIDTASLYAEGNTEKILGSLSNFINAKHLKISTKVNPTWEENGFSEVAIRNQFVTSLRNLNQNEVDILYLHWPSQKDPIEDTLITIDKMYRDGKFKRFGLSNYPAWQVMKIWQLCDKNGWVKPVVYQGMYNMLTREVEKELIPCIRDIGMSFYAYNLLAGGILSGRYKYGDLTGFNETTTPNRFYKTGGKWAKSYQERFWKRDYFDALSEIYDTLVNYIDVEPQNLVGSNSNVQEYTQPNYELLRLGLSWLINSSLLDSKYGDAIILGASSVEQFDMNMNILINNVFKIDNELNERINIIYKKYIDGVSPGYFR